MTLLENNKPYTVMVKVKYMGAGDYIGSMNKMVSALSHDISEHWRPAEGFELELYYNGVKKIPDLSKL